MDGIVSEIATDSVLEGTGEAGGGVASCMEGESKNSRRSAKSLSRPGVIDVVARTFLLRNTG